MANSKRRGNKPNQTGRNEKSGRFSMMPHRVREAAAYASLDLTARALLDELVSIFDGDNNGSIFLSADDARDRLGIADKRPVLRGFAQLQAAGLIYLARDAHFSIKTSDRSRARCWRISWLPWPDCPQKARRVPVWEFEQFQASGSRADRRLRALAKFRRSKASGKFAGVKSSPLDDPGLENPLATGVKFTPVGSGSHAKPPFLDGVKSTPYIDGTMGMVPRGARQVGWWQPDWAPMVGKLVFASLLANKMADMANCCELSAMRNQA